MPRPDECDEVFTELPVTLWDYVGDGTPDELSLEGTSDLLLKVREPCALKSPAAVYSAWSDAQGYLVGDWKTTRDWRYQKTTAELYTNRQGVIYPLAAMRKLDLEAIPGRWAYSITDPAKRREARATDFVQTRAHAEARVTEYFQAARALREKGLQFLALTDGKGAGDLANQRLAFVQEDFSANVSACDDYGGCPHSYERGGACTARRTTGSRIAAMSAASAKSPCAAPDVPLESLLRKSLEQGEGKMSASPWAQKAAAFRNRVAPPPSPAPPVDPVTGLFAAEAVEARASVALDGETRSVEAGDSTGLDPQPEAPAPKRRGRPPGAKNRRPNYGAVEAAPPIDVNDQSYAAEMAEYAALEQAAESEPAAPAISSAEAYVKGQPKPKVDAHVNFHVTESDPPYSHTLSELAALARDLGCEVVIRFPAKAPDSGKAVAP
jgi:hypothetical protein